MSRAKRKKNKQRHSTHTALADHRREGPLLKPPLAQLPNLDISSWINERLPEFLWCAVLITHLPRELVLDVFRFVAKEAKNAYVEGSNPQPTHSSLATLPGDLAGRVVTLVCSVPGAPEVLKALLLLDGLPSRDLWAASLAPRPTLEDWSILARAVAHTIDHQSQEATDCRWAGVLFRVVAGQLKLPSREMAEEIILYPNRGDQRRVRPTIRATEIAFAKGPDVVPSTWAEKFWDECRLKTPCRPHQLVPGASSFRVGTTANLIAAASAALADRSAATVTTTGIDPRHDAVFGFGAYAVAILQELMHLANSRSILGRLGLRSLLDSYVNARYLEKRDDPALWLAFRQYGAGQAKLAFLKRDETEEESFVHLPQELLEAVANEDQFLEYLTINVGHWDNSNLRQLAEKGGSKAEYDAVYPSTSAFVHGNWAALRLACFDLCVNPLHRAHRVLRTSPLALTDVLSDAARLVDGIFEVVDRLYGPFPVRVSVEPAGA